MAGILQLPMQVPGMVGVFPNQKFMVTTDNLATLTTAGYLNQVNLESNPLSNTDILQVLYSFNQQTTMGTYAVFTVTISGTGVITLSQAASTGNVTLPTIANNIIVSTNTTGTLANLTGTAINAGSIQAGLSGTAGTFISFPTTATRGSLILAAVANTGNTNTTISNVAMGQASVISIPDPGTATADFMLAPAALVSGNLVKASGTAGLVVDAGFAVRAQTVVNAGGSAAQTITDAFCTTGSVVVANWATQANPASVLKVTPGNGTFAITSSADAGTATLSYIIIKPAV